MAQLSACRSLCSTRAQVDAYNIDVIKKLAAQSPASDSDQNGLESLKVSRARLTNMTARTNSLSDDSVVSGSRNPDIKTRR
jgi:hypothetical protein